jgi:dihydropteroate synthase
MTESPDAWQIRDRTLQLGQRPLVMGILNVTPDSFSDGGRFATLETALAHGLRLIEDGADLLDLGGESTRPGSQPVSLQEELKRVIPLVKALAQRTNVPLSVDTTKAEVARQALEAGAHVINDVSGLQDDPGMAAVAREFGAGVILMHRQGTPATMQINPTYADVAAEVTGFLQARLQALADLGIARPRVVLDPGIGFGKTVAHNLELLARLDELRCLGRPVCLGVSRKGFLGTITGRPVDRRLAGSLAVACYALGRDVAQILRVHDVAETRDAVEVYLALRRARSR